MTCTDTDNYVNVLLTIKKEKKRKKMVLSDTTSTEACELYMDCINYFS